MIDCYIIANKSQKLFKNSMQNPILQVVLRKTLKFKQNNISKCL